MGAWVCPTAGDNVLDRDVVKLDNRASTHVFKTKLCDVALPLVAGVETIASFPKGSLAYCGSHTVSYETAEVSKRPVK